LDFTGRRTRFFFGLESESDSLSSASVDFSRDAVGLTIFFAAPAPRVRVTANNARRIASSPAVSTGAAGAAVRDAATVGCVAAGEAAAAAKVDEEEDEDADTGVAMAVAFGVRCESAEYVGSASRLRISAPRIATFSFCNNR